MHVIVTTSPIADAIDAAGMLALAGAFAGEWRQADPPIAAGQPVRVDVAGVPDGSSFWYTVLEYAS